MVRSLIIMSFAFALVGCNTRHGVGKDIEKAGEAMQDASQ